MKQDALNEKELPHVETFYFDAFTAAFSLVSQRKSPREFQSQRSLLFNNPTKFFTLAIKLVEEKKKAGSLNVDFESHIQFQTVENKAAPQKSAPVTAKAKQVPAEAHKTAENTQEEVFTGGASKRKTRSETTAETPAKEVKQKVAKNEPTPTDNTRPNLIVVVCPPFAVTLGAVKILSDSFQLYQADSISKFRIPKE